MTNELAKKVVILSGAVNEALEDHLSSKNFSYQRRFLNSNIENWSKIIGLINSLREVGELAAVVAYFTEETLFFTSEQEYLPYWPVLLDEIKKVPNLIFVYEDNLFGTFSRIVDLEEKIEKLQEPRNIQRSFLQSNEEMEQEHKALVEQEKSKLDDYKVRVGRIYNLYNEVYSRNMELVPYKKRAEKTARAQDFIDEIEGGFFLSTLCS